MSRIYDLLATDLCSVIDDLGKDGGLIGPSFYDTAQGLRFAPPPEGVWPALDWLIAQQHTDGGWGDLVSPRARDASTLAVVLALATYGHRARDRASIEAGLTFLRRSCGHWGDPLPDDIPVAVEMILPSLLDQAHKFGLDVLEKPYASLIALGDHRRRLIAEAPHRAGTAPIHSWEAWGHAPERIVIDGTGGVGHSPAATAAWVRAATSHPELADTRQQALRFLEGASAATGAGVPGVLPAVWPHSRSEQILSLYALQLAGLLDMPLLTAAVRRQIDDVWHNLRPDGYGMTEEFVTDGDITTMAFAVIGAGGYRPDMAILQSYIVDNYCLTYRRELQRSLSATAHAAHAFSIFGEDPAPLLSYICEHRTADGRWLGDKWHASWFYLTCHTIHALLHAGWHDEALTSLQALLDHQREDGGWAVTTAIAEETAYVVIALLGFDQAGLLPERGRQALHRAGRWLLYNYRPLVEETGACWIGKELYRPRRIARTYELSATLACLLKGYGR